ncbi:MAG: GNAT family N-acetyltransferase [Planctomycetes bacterium]|nr:GNAT family N-acetyltransferase [Planctomycetota bacterium]
MPLDGVEVARRLERRQATSTAALADETIEVAGGLASFGGVGAWLNQACAVGLDGPVAPGEVERLVAFYAERGVEPKVILSPFVDPTLLEALGARGFFVREFETVLARDLHPGEDLSPAALSPQAPPAGLTLERVDPADAVALASYVDVSTAGFRPEGAPPDPVLSRFVVDHVRRPGVWAVLARLDGQPIGGGALEVGEEVGALMGASVLPAARRRGVQQALIARRLELAREAGARLATIQARPGIPTERNAGRLGFRVAYTRATVAMAGPGLAPSP